MTLSPVSHAVTPSAAPRAPGWLVWIGFVVLCNGTGILSSLAGNEPAFYERLVRPSWAPPPWVFGPVWTALYTAMGTATYLVWRRGVGAPRRRALVIFAVQLALNAAWTPVFFGLHQIGLALVVLIGNWLAVLAMLVAYARVSALAGWLIAPLLAWVTFAAALNAAIWQLN